MAEVAKQPISWADDDDHVEDASPDGSYIKEVVEIITTPEGDKVKVTRRVRVVKTVIKVHKKVAERRHWRKFGAAEHAGPGPERGITAVGDEVPFEFTKKIGPGLADKKEENAMIKSLAAAASRIKKRASGDAPAGPSSMPLPNISLVPRVQQIEPVAEASGPAKYVPPSLRNREAGASSSSAGGRGFDRDQEITLHVSNLSEEADEDGLRQLFKTFGPLQRVHMPKDRETNEYKGFAYVSFYDRKSADAAIEKLDGRGWNNLIMHVKYAIPRDSASASSSAGPVSASQSTGGGWSSSRRF